MTQIIGTINNSIGVGLTCYLKVELAAPLIDDSTSPDSVYYSVPEVYKIVNGSFATVEDLEGNEIVGGVELVPTDEPTYKFSATYEDTTLELYLDGKLYASVFSDGTGTGGDWNYTNVVGDTPDLGLQYYTGAVYSASSQLLTQFNRVNKLALFEPFNSNIPDQATLEWSALQHSSINTSNINTSMYYIAKLVTSGSNLQDLVAGIYNPMGEWNVGTQYTKGDVVYYPSDLGSYWYINDSPSTGNLPTNATYWQKLLTSYDTGAGDPTSVLDNTAFSPSWSGVTNKAPTQNSVYNQLIQYALLADATFTALKTVTKSLGTNTTDVATTAFVQNALSAFVPPSPTTSPSIEQVDRSLKIVNSTTLKAVTSMVAEFTEEKPPGQNGGVGSGAFFRFIEFEKFNAVYNIAGTGNMCTVIPPYVQLRPGLYYIEGEAAACGVDGHRIKIRTSGGSDLLLGNSEHSGLTGYQSVYYPNNWAKVSGRISLAVDTNIGIYHNMQTVGSSQDQGRPCNRGGNEIYARLRIFRIGEAI